MGNNHLFDDGFDWWNDGSDDDWWLDDDKKCSNEGCKGGCKSKCGDKKEKDGKCCKHLKCDCGADKAKTTHADWCSSKCKCSGKQKVK